MDIHVLNSSTEELEEFSFPFAQLLSDAVEQGASVGYLAGTSIETYEEFWEQELREVHYGRAKILYATKENEIVGVVELAFAPKQTAQHRAEVRKLLVRSDMQGQGIASKLMHYLELEARMSGKSLLVLDTEADSDADYLYPKLGWSVTGTVPDYAASPDGELSDCTFYYKQLY